MSAAENSSIDRDLLNTLTPEEQAAMSDGETSAEDLAALAKVAGDAQPAQGAATDDDDEDDDGPADPNLPPVEGKGAAPETPAPAAAPAPAAEAPAPAAEPEPEPAPVAERRYKAELPADYDTKMQSIKDRDAEARQRFKDGDIDIEERDRILDTLRDEREELLVTRARVETLNSMNAQDAEQTWQNTVLSFMADTAKLPADQGGIDYRKDQEALEAFDQEVKALAAMPRHADKSPSWFLENAHKRVMLERGISVSTAKPSAPAPAPAPATPKQANAQRSAAEAIKAASESSLANVPGGEGPGDVGAGEFADVLALEGQDFEDAIARMTPAQREKFKAAL